MVVKSEPVHPVEQELLRRKHAAAARLAAASKPRSCFVRAILGFVGLVTTIIRLIVRVFVFVSFFGTMLPVIAAMYVDKTTVINFVKDCFGQEWADLYVPIHERILENLKSTGINQDHKFIPIFRNDPPFSWRTVFSTMWQYVYGWY